MDETQAEEATPVVGGDDAGIMEILGLFDVPAFARRGHELEYALSRLARRVERERTAMLDMVQLRLRQWSSVSAGPDDWSDVFTAPVAALFLLACTETVSWAEYSAPSRRRRVVGRDLAASVARFNRRWTDFLEKLKLESVNRQIDHYNRYYVLEKECVIGSARLAARHFVPRPILTTAMLLAHHPTLPVLELVP
jgi:hypothetical protein